MATEQVNIDLESAYREVKEESEYRRNRILILSQEVTDLRKQLAAIINSQVQTAEPEIEIIPPTN